MPGSEPVAGPHVSLVLYFPTAGTLTVASIT